jgi:hypothetical protein
VNGFSRWRLPRLLGVLPLLGGAWITAGPTGPARAAPPAPIAGRNPPVVTADVQPGVAAGQDKVVVLAQSPWIGPSGNFHLQLEVTTHDPAHDRILVQGYSRLTTRSGFDDALAGHIGGYVRYTAVVDLSALPPDSAGGIDLDIPVNQAGPSSGLPEFQAVGGSGVFPLQVGLYDQSGVAQGQPITTFLVYAAGTPAQTGLPKLSVAVVLAVHASPAVGKGGQLPGLPSGQAGALAGLVDVLSAHPGVTVSLAVTPQTLDAMGSGPPAERAILDGLSYLARGPDQILPATYASLPMVGLPAAGLGRELDRQVTTGSAVLAGVFGAAPQSGTWVVDQPLDPATWLALQRHGARNLIVPDADLSQLPTLSRQTTFALSAGLTAGGRNTGLVYGADTGLTADFSNPGGPVLAASQLLAEMAMIQLETPGLTRGVAVLPPSGWAAQPAFVATLLDGLAGHPLLAPVSASRLFSSVEPASVPRTLLGAGSPVPAGGAQGRAAASALAGDAATVQLARQQINGLAAILPADSKDAQQTARLDRELLTAESSDLSAGPRGVLLGQIIGSTRKVMSEITLPHASSITLTSTRGQIPLTVLSVASLHARVELRLSSQRLIFRMFSPLGGHCRVPTPTNEICDLTLTSQNTTVKVPVEARSSGVFPLEVSLWSPDGSQLLARDRDTVRSTAVSGVGIVLIVVAIVSLAIWWVRDLRHGRRRRSLVPPPIDDEAPGPDAAGTPDGSSQQPAGLSP